MIDVPWYMLSPSIYTLTVWSMLAILQTKKLGAYGIKKWLYGFSVCAFSLGLVVLPFDSLWVIFQNVRFGYLYPDERWITLISSLARNILFLLFCIYETRENFKHLNMKALLKLSIFIPIFIVWFGLAPDPSYTDWTYAWRFEYGIERTITAFIISHVGLKLIQAVIYFNLWRYKIEEY